MKLTLARYRFSFRLEAPLQLPEFAGSLLRGQFGASLRKVSCMTGEKSCDACPLRATCPYPAIFETPAPASHTFQNFSHVPNPYVIEPPPFGACALASGEMLQFSIVLIGRAVAQLPLISIALQRALATGLGRERASARLERIDWLTDNQPVLIWQAGDTTIAAHDATLTLPQISAPERVGLTLHTPMRLQHQGHPVRPDALTPRKLIADLLRRTTLLFEFHFNQPGLITDVPALVRHAETLTHAHALRWQDWSRYSSRQQQQMTLGGAVGTWTLEGELNPLQPWLWLGQWLHVGKNATMGMGRYTLD